MNSIPSPSATFDWLQEKAFEFMDSPANDMEAAAPEPAFGRPILGVAAGDDPLWAMYKQEYVGDFHWTPAEAFNLGFPEEQAGSEDLSVLVWILPQTAKTKADNRKETFYPSERWARTRILGEPRVNTGLRLFLIDALAGHGIKAVAPVKLPQWDRRLSPVYGFASNWSERHAAYAAGLGTFGLSDGLITPVGKAVRVGSLIIHHKIPATPRPYSGHREYCLYFHDGSCGACVKRCPVDSVRFEGRDKTACRAHTRGACQTYIEEQWGLKGHGCGLCQTKVPCESGIPKKIMEARANGK